MVKGSGKMKYFTTGDKHYELEGKKYQEKRNIFKGNKMFLMNESR